MAFASICINTLPIALTNVILIEQKVLIFQVLKFNLHLLSRPPLYFYLIFKTFLTHYKSYSGKTIEKNTVL